MYVLAVCPCELTLHRKNKRKACHLSSESCLKASNQCSSSVDCSRWFVPFSLGTELEDVATNLASRFSSSVESMTKEMPAWRPLPLLNWNMNLRAMKSRSWQSTACAVPACWCRIPFCPNHRRNDRSGFRKRPQSFLQTTAVVFIFRRGAQTLLREPTM